MNGLPPDPDDQLFLLLQSMGYGPEIPLWQYQQMKRKDEERILSLHQLHHSENK
jgi:hypothetical protein